MRTFSITEAARVEIRRLIESGRYRSPVITLRESAPVDLPGNLKSALVKRVSDRELLEVRQIVEKQLREDRGSSSLAVEAYEREECQPDDLSEIDGFTVAMTVPMREALRDYRLTYAGGRFMLESDDELVASLRSIKALSGWFT